MSRGSLTASVILYSKGELTLTQAAERSGVPPEAMKRELRSRGIPVREDSEAEESIKEPT
jgi:predicted HTH domain antitoxin